MAHEQLNTTPANMGSEHRFPSSSREVRNLAEKVRRDKLNRHVTELASLVPLVAGAGRKVDKTSVLRLAASYIRMNDILSKEEASGVREVLPGLLDAPLSHTLSQAIGGFLLVVTSTGKVAYVAQAIEHFFGHTQVDLLGHSVYGIIHPEDRLIMEEQLSSTGSSRRSFFCRMTEKVASKGDPCRYEIIHVVGSFRPLPHPTPTKPTSAHTPSPTTVPSRDLGDSGRKTSCDSDLEDAEVMQVVQRSGTHMLVCFVRVVKDRPINELSLVESTQDEYITRHTMDGKILYTDHRISFVTGLMPGEVMGTSAFQYMHPEDMMWSIVAHKLMFTSSQGQGVVSYRLRCKDGTHVTLRSRGYIEMNKQTGQVDTFVCINTVVSVKEAKGEIRNQRQKLLPLIINKQGKDHLSSLAALMPPELRDGMKQTISSENFRKIIASIDPHLDKELSQNPVAPQEDSSPQMPTPAGMTNSLCTQKKTSTKHGHFSGHVRKDYSDTGCSPQSTVQEPKTIIVDNPCIEATRKRGSEEDLCNVPSKKMGVMPVLAQTEQKSSYKPPNNSLEVQHKTNLVNSGSHLSKSPLHDQRQIGFLNNSSQNSIIDDHSPAGDNLTRVIGSLFMMDNKKQLENVSTSESSFSNQIGYSSEYSTGTYHQMSDFTPAHEDSYQPTRTNVISCAINNSFECDNSGSVKQNGRQKYRNDVMASKCNFQSDCLSSKKLHSVQHQNRGQTETSNHDSQMFPQNQVYSQQEVSTKQVSQYQDGGCLSYGQQFIPPQTNISSHQGCQLSLPSSSDLNFKVQTHLQQEHHHPLQQRHQCQEQHIQQEKHQGDHYHQQLKLQQCQEHHHHHHLQQCQEHHHHLQQCQEQQQHHHPRYNYHHQLQQQQQQQQQQQLMCHEQQQPPPPYQQQQQQSFQNQQQLYQDRQHHNHLLHQTQLQEQCQEQQQQKEPESLEHILPQQEEGQHQQQRQHCQEQQYSHHLQRSHSQQHQSYQEPQRLQEEQLLHQRQQIEHELPLQQQRQHLQQRQQYLQQGQQWQQGQNLQQINQLQHEPNLQQRQHKPLQPRQHLQQEQNIQQSQQIEHQHHHHQQSQQQPQQKQPFQLVRQNCEFHLQQRQEQESEHQLPQVNQHHLEQVLQAVQPSQQQQQPGCLLMNEAPETRKDIEGTPVIFTHCSSSVSFQDEDYQLCESSSGTTVENSLFHQYGANFQPQIVDQFSGQHL